MGGLKQTELSRILWEVVEKIPIKDLCQELINAYTNLAFLELAKANTYGDEAPDNDKIENNYKHIATIVCNPEWLQAVMRDEVLEFPAPQYLLPFQAVLCDSGIEKGRVRDALLPENLLTTISENQDTRLAEITALRQRLAKALSKIRDHTTTLVSQTSHTSWEELVRSQEVNKHIDEGLMDKFWEQKKAIKTILRSFAPTSRNLYKSLFEDIFPQQTWSFYFGNKSSNTRKITTHNIEKMLNRLDSMKSKPAGYDREAFHNLLNEHNETRALLRNTEHFR